MFNQTLTLEEETTIRLALQEELNKQQQNLKYWQSVSPTSVSKQVEYIEKKIDMIECLYQMFLECEHIVATDCVRRNKDGSERLATA